MLFDYPKLDFLFVWQKWTSIDLKATMKIRIFSKSELKRGSFSHTKTMYELDYIVHESCELLLWHLSCFEHHPSTFLSPYGKEQHDLSLCSEALKFWQLKKISKRAIRSNANYTFWMAEIIDWKCIDFKDACKQC